MGTGERKRVNVWSHTIFGGPQNMRGGGPLARYGQKQWRMEEDKSTGRI